MKHTPGPWRVGKNYASVVADHPVPEIRGSDDTEAYGGHLICESAAECNQALIAAAPELLAACKAALGAFEQNNAIDWGDLERAIAKAEGTVE